MADINVEVKRVQRVTVKSKLEVGDYTVTVTSQARGIRLNIKKSSDYYSNDITIPNQLFDVVGDIFKAVKEAKEKEEANGN